MIDSPSILTEDHLFQIQHLAAFGIFPGFNSIKVKSRWKFIGVPYNLMTAGRSITPRKSFNLTAEKIIDIDGNL